jgi:hypothetical protein
VSPLEASGGWPRPLECNGRACSSRACSHWVPTAGGATMHPAPTPPARNRLFPKGRMGPDASKRVLLERESVHSCTEKAIDYWRIAAIAASTPI